MNTFGMVSSPHLPMVWLRPRTIAAPVANSSAARSRVPVPLGLQESAITPTTVAMVPSEIQVLIDSPRKAMAVNAAKSGAVAEKVAAIVGPVRAVASRAIYIDRKGWTNPFRTNIQNPLVNQSCERIHSGAVTR